MARMVYWKASLKSAPLKHQKVWRKAFSSKVYIYWDSARLHTNCTQFYRSLGSATKRPLRRRIWRRTLSIFGPMRASQPRSRRCLPMAARRLFQVNRFTSSLQSETSSSFFADTTTRTELLTWWRSTPTGSPSKSWKRDLESSWIGPQICKSLLERNLIKIQKNPCSPDVWFVTTTQALTWMTDPKGLKQLDKYEPWSCNKKENLPPAPCKTSNKCALSFKRENFTDTRYLETCIDCPNQYPWLGDATGSGIPNKDNYVPDNVWVCEQFCATEESLPKKTLKIANRLVYLYNIVNYCLVLRIYRAGFSVA